MGKKVQKSICIFSADYLLEQIHQMEDQLDGALLGQDIEYIHQIRVASRRLRNGLACFLDCLPKKKAKVWQSDIKKITRAMGNARDLDIQIELLDQLYEDNLDAKYKPGYRRLLLRLKQQRTKSQAKVNKAISKLKKDDTLLGLRTQLEKMANPSKNTYLFTPSLYQRAFSTINDNLKDFLSYEKYIGDPENIKELHAMRIAGKHLRYTIEIFAPIYNMALLPYIQLMKDIQDQLGEIHDDDVWISWLPTFIEKERERIEDYFGNTGPLKRLLPGINHLIEDRQAARDREYQAFLSTWESLLSEKAWENLVKIIKVPINIEAALAHLAEEETFDPEILADIEEIDAEGELEAKTEEALAAEQPEIEDSTAEEESASAQESEVPLDTPQEEENAKEG